MLSSLWQEGNLEGKKDQQMGCSHGFRFKSPRMREIEKKLLSGPPHPWIRDEDLKAGSWGARRFVMTSSGKEQGG